jgi:hypothetical protein
MTANLGQAGTWDDLLLGQAVEPIEHVIDGGMVAAFNSVLAAGEGRAPNAAPRTMPPTLLATDYVLLLLPTLQLGFGLMSRHETHALSPITVGDRVTVSGIITDKFIRKDRHYWTMRYEVRNSGGILCVVYIVTCSVD